MFKKITIALISAGLIATISACSKAHKNSGPRNTINVDNAADIPTLDPAMGQDVTSARVDYDLFEGLTSFDQTNKIIPGLAEKWDISQDGKTYTFHLRRQGLKFSDGTPITANDVVFTWQRLVDPKVASPYNFLAANVVNGQGVIDGKLSPTALDVKALDSNTIQFTLNHPDASFLAICSMPNVGIVSKSNVTKFGQQWTNPGNMVSSGAYKLTELVVQGHATVTKNSYYYDAKDVAIENVKFLPIEDASSSYSQYQSGSIDITYALPIDQYKAIKTAYPKEEHTVSQEALYYYDLNMTEPRFRNNPKLRQALSMAVDRNALVEQVLGQGQPPLYSYSTSTVEGGKFAGLDYEWSKWPRDKQVAMAQQLFKEAGYSPNNPLKISIQYNTNDGHKKISLAIASMWQQVFGDNSIQVTSSNQEWKTFLKSRNTASYDVARDGWVADYDSVDSYTALYQCKSPQNNSKYCNPAYDKLIAQAQAATDPTQRVELIRQALKIAMYDYGIIPLYQYTYYRLVSPQVKNYNPDNNHLDHVMSKWYKF